MKNHSLCTLTIIALITVMNASTRAQEKQNARLRSYPPKLDSLTTEWTYEFSLAKRETVSIHIYFPDSPDLAVISSLELENSKIKPKIKKGEWILEIADTTITDTTVVVKAKGSNQRFKNGAVKYIFKNRGNVNIDSNFVIGPVLKDNQTDKQEEQSALSRSYTKKLDHQISAWVYEFTLKEKSGISIQISFPYSPDLVISTSPELKENTTRHGNGEWSLELKDKKLTSIYITVSGSNQRFKDGVVKYVIKEDSKKADTSFAIGPELQFNPEFFRPMVGAGLGYLADDVIDFDEKNNFLFVKNDSRLRPVLLAGLLFNFKGFAQKLKIPGPRIASNDSAFKKFMKHSSKLITFPLNLLLFPLRMTDDVLFSVEFTQGTSPGVDGVVFGISKRISNDLSFVIGYSRRRGRELSPGFKNAAKKVITDSASYKQFSKYVSGGNEKELDGFPLTMGAEKVFPGAVIIDSFNSAFSAGLVISPNLKGLFSSSK